MSVLWWSSEGDVLLQPANGRCTGDFQRFAVEQKKPDSMHSFGVLFILYLYELKKGPKQSSVRELWAVVTPVKDTGEVSEE